MCPNSSLNSTFLSSMVVTGEDGTKIWRLPSSFPRATCLCASLALCLVTGCIQEMANQPRLEPLEGGSSTGEVKAPRSPVAGTIARGQLQSDTHFATGRIDGELAATLPASISEHYSEGELLPRGRERFEIFCSHCHGYIGGGTGGDESMLAQVGMVVQRGFPSPPTYHQDRLRNAPLGHFFDVITNGLGRMAAHGYLVPPEDRWAIAAYIRALQLSQHAPRESLTPGDLSRLAENTSQNE